MPRRDRRASIGFKIENGVNAGLAHGSWAINTHGEDTYIWVVKGVLKVSLHGDAAWQVAYTSEHVASGRAPAWPGEGRTVFPLTPTPFDVHGRRMVLLIAVQRDAMLSHPLPRCDAVISVQDKWDEITVACLWMTEPGVVLEPTERVVAGPLPLRSGRNIWVSQRTDVWTPPERPDLPCVGAIVEPTDWSADGPLAPLLLVRGFHVV